MLKRLLIIPAFAAFAPFSRAAEKPDILFIFVDDMSARALETPPEERELKIPNIDSIFAEGTAFTNAYLQGSWVNAVCVASRTCLNTGYGVWRGARAYQNSGKLLKEAASRGELWPQLMKKAGYKTFLTGKWHVSVPAAEVFDSVEFLRNGMPKAAAEQYNRPIDGVKDPWSPADPKFGGYYEGGKHWTEVTADCAIEYMKRNAASAEPLFMYVAFNAPHDPRQAEARFQKMYPPEKIALPPNFEGENRFAAAIKLRDVRDETIAPYPRTPSAVRTHISEYYAITTHLDENIGRVLRALEETGRVQNTVVVFAADNGLSMGEHGFMGKQNMFDCSMKVPLAIRGGGFEKNVKVRTPVYLQDVMPTILELAKAEIPEYVDYRSLAPLARGEGGAAREEIYIGFMDTQRALVKDGFKIISYPQIGEWLLFNLESDKYEMRDLSKDPAFSARLDAMKHALKHAEEKSRSAAN